MGLFSVHLAFPLRGNTACNLPPGTMASRLSQVYVNYITLHLFHQPYARRNSTPGTAGDANREDEVLRTGRAMSQRLGQSLNRSCRAIPLSKTHSTSRRSGPARRGDELRAVLEHRRQRLAFDDVSPGG